MNFLISLYISILYHERNNFTNKKAPSFEEAFFIYKNVSYLLLIAACAAAKRAIGTRNGEQDT